MTLMMIVVQSNFIVKNLFEGIIWYIHNLSLLSLYVLNVNRFLLPCSIIICNDIFAYFCGFFLGKKFTNRPFLKISPNKTWEGFIGAMFWTLLFGFYVCTLIGGEHAISNIYISLLITVRSISGTFVPAQYVRLIYIYIISCFWS